MAWKIYQSGLLTKGKPYGLLRNKSKKRKKMWETQNASEMEIRFLYGENPCAAFRRKFKTKFFIFQKYKLNAILDFVNFQYG